MKTKTPLGILFLLTFLFSTLSGQDDSKRIIMEKSIKTKGANHVKAKFEMVVGSIQLSGEDIGNLLDAECIYYDERWEPKFEYTVSENLGKLHISNREGVTDNNYDESDQSEWNLLINEDVSSEISIYLGAGEANIDLEACNISKFDYEMKAGDCEINLKNTSIPLLNIKAIVGEALVDLSGRWENDLNAYIKGGVGDLTLVLPDNYSIELRISGALGDVDARGFIKKGKYYYRNSDENKETLYIEINGGIGEVDVQLVD